MEKKNKIFFAEFFILIFIISSVSARNITVNYPEEVEVNEEFEINLGLIDFQEDIYDVKIDIFCEEVRISKIFNGEWKSTYYYLNDVIENQAEKEFLLKINQECEEADITIKIKNSKDEAKTFSGYEIKCVEDEIIFETEKENDEGEDSEEGEDDEKEETTKKESLLKVESSFDKIEENISLKPIVLNAESIKSENDKEFSTKNLAFYGVISFCVVFGALFFFKKRKYKNEFQ